MATHDETVVPMRAKSPLTPEPRQGIRELVGETPVKSEPESHDPDDFPTLPLPEDAYKAHSRPGNKPVPTLHFVMGDTIRGLPTANYDSIDWLVPDKPGASPAIVMRFSGIVPREAVITGRNLFGLFKLLSDHRVAWVRALPKGRDFIKDPAATVVTGIVVNRIKEMPDGASGKTEGGS
jgi:hypothetical protein